MKNNQMERLNNTIRQLEDTKTNLKEDIKTYQQNGKWDSVVKGKDLLIRTNKVLMRAKKVRKTYLFTGTFENVDESTVNAESNIPVTREYLQANYKVSNKFNGVSLNSINDNLPHKLSQHTLNKLVVETFPDVQSRQCTNDIKYNMELVKWILENLKKYVK